MNLIYKYNADILCYGVIDLYEGITENFSKINNENEIITELSPEDAVEEMLLPKHVDIITCNKIIKKAYIKMFTILLENYMKICLQTTK